MASKPSQSEGKEEEKRWRCNAPPPTPAIDTIQTPRAYTHIHTRTFYPHIGPLFPPINVAQSVKREKEENEGFMRRMVHGNCPCWHPSRHVTKGKDTLYRVDWLFRVSRSTMNRSRESAYTPDLLDK